MPMLSLSAGEMGRQQPQQGVWGEVLNRALRSDMTRSHYTAAAQLVALSAAARVHDETSVALADYRHR